MKQYNNETMERGVSLYLAIMVMTILLTIGLGVSLIIVSQMRMIRGMENSVIAFHAADTGIEEIMYRDKLCWLENCPAYCHGYPDACSGLPEIYIFSGNLDTDKNYDASHDHDREGPSEGCYDFNDDGVVTATECGDCAICPNTEAGLRHDLCLFIDHWGTYESGPNWDPMYDIAPPGGDGWVDLDDLMAFSAQVGKVCDYLFYNFKSVGAFKKTKRAIKVTIYGD